MFEKELTRKQLHQPRARILGGAMGALLLGVVGCCWSDELVEELEESSGVAAPGHAGQRSPRTEALTWWAALKRRSGAAAARPRHVSWKHTKQAQLIIKNKDN